MDLESVAKEPPLGDVRTFARALVFVASDLQAGLLEAYANNVLKQRDCLLRESPLPDKLSTSFQGSSVFSKGLLPADAEEQITQHAEIVHKRKDSAHLARLVTSSLSSNQRQGQQRSTPQQQKSTPTQQQQAPAQQKGKRAGKGKSSGARGAPKAAEAVVVVRRVMGTFRAPVGLVTLVLFAGRPRPIPKK